MATKATNQMIPDEGTVEMIGDRYVLRFERRFAHPVERVWDALTRPDRIVQWMGESELEVDLVEGGRFNSRVTGPPDLVGIGAPGRLVIDDDQALVPPVEQVDVALEQPVADRRAGVHLAPVRVDGGGPHHCRRERVLDQGADVVGSVGHGLGLALGRDGIIEPGAGGQVDRLQDAVHCPAHQIGRAHV